MTDRVQIPAYTDRWMMGDRFGEIVKTGWSRPRTSGAGADGKRVEIAHVRLDVSGKTVRVVLDDCTVV